MIACIWVSLGVRALSAGNTGRGCDSSIVGICSSKFFRSTSDREIEIESREKKEGTKLSDGRVLLCGTIIEHVASKCVG